MKRLVLLFLAIMTILMIGTGSVAAQTNEMCVTINGAEVCGKPSEIAQLLSLQAQEQVNETTPEEKLGVQALFEGIEYDFSSALSDGCLTRFAEHPYGDLWYRVRETMNRSEVVNGRLMSVAPDTTTGSELHADWPAWFGLHQTWTNRAVACPEMRWDIATKMVIQATEEEDLYLKYHFVLDIPQLTQTMNAEYYVAAGDNVNNDLGLFIGSVKGVEILVNGEPFLLRGQFCHDCVNHTTIVDETVDNEITSGEISHFGNSQYSAPLQEVIIVPIDLEEPDAIHTIEVRLQKGDDLVLWFGVANNPENAAP